MQFRLHHEDLVLLVSASCTGEFAGNSFSNCMHICYTREMSPNESYNHFGPRSEGHFQVVLATCLGIGWLSDGHVRSLTSHKWLFQGSSFLTKFHRN